MKSLTSFGLVGATLLGTVLMTLQLVAAQETDAKLQEGTNPPSSSTRVVDANFKKAFGTFKISLTQAIASAETHTKGKSFEAMMKMGPAVVTGSGMTPPTGDSKVETKPAGDNSLYVEVCVLANDKVLKVHVDQNGKIVSVSENKNLYGKQ